MLASRSSPTMSLSQRGKRGTSDIVGTYSLSCQPPFALNSSSSRFSSWSSRTQQPNAIAKAVVRINNSKRGELIEFSPPPAHFDKSTKRGQQGDGDGYIDHHGEQAE